ncbi:hypothetical protein BCR24_03145 [Enterococcus ureilyticus]|uniref:Uncharacterized protein n=1 Tax=Enterococcus ureilyticus TaxID=1131292 RepID=A0A1E5HB03_9ENTE|nr:hypothetical protein [Enterococcus ureilyticus]MBM7690577.1 hypothetical protein [Enterococcus ureilyticus]OEG22142.1 hypothetical protein BCR24_03145 [Enterococcus ureilyticus]
MEKKLNNLIKESDFIDKMHESFVMTNSDTDIIDTGTMENLKKLDELYVDINGHLESLVKKSMRSSGVVSGLRGTGKTHLLLLARERINHTSEKNFCFYINLKQLNFPENLDLDATNKIFSIKIYEEISKQLLYHFEQIEYTFFEFLVKRKGKYKILEAINFLEQCLFTASIGNLTINDDQKMRVEKERTLENINESIEKMNMKLSSKNGMSIDAELNEKEISKDLDRLMTHSDMRRYLDISTFKDNMKELLDILGKDRFTFYFDDWEKLRNKDKSLQENLSKFIDTINVNPIFIWIGIVPGRGDLHSLVQGSDLPHRIDLDDSLIFEKSSTESKKCQKYFKELVEKRLNYFVPDKNLKVTDLLTTQNFFLLIHASMGNSRDFLNMLSNSWDGYYSANKASRGNTHKKISKDMVISSIENISTQKIENIVNKPEVMDIWNDIKKFCLEKEYSHFAIKTNYENNILVRHEWFEELIYQRIIHRRRRGMSQKEASYDDVDIYAINYSMIYDRVAGRNKKIEFVLDSDIIHNKIRRYIYSPAIIFSTIESRRNEIAKCKHCDKEVNKNDNEYMWKQKKCPSCGSELDI